jgi:hypothetical protein
MLIYYKQFCTIPYFFEHKILLSVLTERPRHCQLFLLMANVTFWSVLFVITDFCTEFFDQRILSNT